MKNHPTRRVRLRFPDLIESEPPVGTMFLDAALDLLGRERFPKDWGMTAIWKQQPFRAATSDGPFYRYRPSRDEGGRWTIQRAKTVGGYNPDHLKQAEDIYRQVATQFRLGAEQGLFRAQYARSDDTFKVVNPARWSLGLIGIFYTGFVYRGRPSDCRSRAPVLIDANSYEAWLRHPDSPSKEMSPAALERLLTTLIECSNRNDIKFTKKRLWRLVSQIAQEQQVTLAEHRFNRSIWDASGMKPHHARAGKPTREQKQALDRAEAEVRTSIAQAIQTRQQPPAIHT
ncbi:hypothetical protein [Lichenibacterium dinghuense]|uniref:hypothetical protein n=1 Tax=Lichenibacterium dinghuense TaxID=2895977 RepID=UPI001F2B8177|nr:hypothetical protein [Lichenibacterium sp. 6Y81]